MLNSLSLTNNKIALLSKQTGWYGAHSGYYEQIPSYLKKISPRLELVSPSEGFIKRIIGKFYSIYKKQPSRNQSVAFAEFQFEMMCRLGNHNIKHILGIENHIPLIKNINSKMRICGTLHFPPILWDEEALNCLGNLLGLIVLYKKDIPLFEKYMGAGKVHYACHGVDTDFFHKSQVNDASPNKLLFVGQFLRDFEFMEILVRTYRAINPKAEFHFVVASPADELPIVKKIKNISGTYWYKNLSDEDLRSLYYSSYLMILPLKDSGANNAIVEALACGCPIVTNNVGGIVDYGGNDLFPLFETRNLDSAISLIEKYNKQPEWREDVSNKISQYAKVHLTWEKSAKSHLKAYQSIYDSN